MKKQEFLERLEYLLQGIPDADREEALAYYRDCIEEAGGEDEEDVIARLGSPERAAALICADLSGNLKDGGSFTDNGFTDERFRDPNFEVANRLDLPDRVQDQEGSGETHGDGAYFQADPGGSAGPGASNSCPAGSGQTGGAPGKRGSGFVRFAKAVLIVVLVCVASPFVLGAAGIVAGIVSFVGAVVITAILVTVGLTVLAFIIAAALGAFGVVFLIGSPLNGMFLIGLALISLGCGVFGAVLTGLVFWLAVLLVKGVVKLARRLIGSRTAKRKEAGRS